MSRHKYLKITHLIHVFYTIYKHKYKSKKSLKKMSFSIKESNPQLKLSFKSYSFIPKIYLDMYYVYIVL